MGDGTRPQVLAALSVAVLLGGCTAGAGDASTSAGGGPSADVRVGLIDYSFQISASQLAATKATLTVTNAGSTRHDMQVLDGKEVLAATRMLEPGEKQSITVDLAGLDQVTLVCTVPGHREIGMVEDVEVVSASGPSDTGSSR